MKAIEPVTFIFTKSYPADAPLICLRDDFDRGHPHIHPGPPSIPPVPCYVDGQTREFMRLQGIRGIADQLSRWLEKAAFGALIGEDDEWEPTRRDSFGDFDGGFGAGDVGGGVEELANWLTTNGAAVPDLATFIAWATLNGAQADLGLPANPDAGLAGITVPDPVPAPSPDESAATGAP